MQENYEELINAIILQACKDLWWAIIRVRTHPDDLLAHRMIADVERFFRSEWFAFLRPFDGEWMLQEIKRRIK